MDEKDCRPQQGKTILNIQSLKDVTLYLSGIKDGKGNLLPMGTIVLEDLHAIIAYLQGDVRYISERDTRDRD